MHTTSKIVVITSFLSVAISGCVTAEKVAPPPGEHPPSTLLAEKPVRPTLHPVEHQLPPWPPGTYEPGQVSIQPVPKVQAPPQYPVELRKAGIEGQGIVVFTVAKDGSVGDAMVLKATDVRFGDAALAAVTGWKFIPAKVRGAAVNCRMIVPIIFSLNSN